MFRNVRGKKREIKSWNRRGKIWWRTRKWDVQTREKNTNETKKKRGSFQEN